MRIEPTINDLQVRRANPYTAKRRPKFCSSWWLHNRHLELCLSTKFETKSFLFNCFGSQLFLWIDVLLCQYSLHYSWGDIFSTIIILLKLFDWLLILDSRHISQNFYIYQEKRWKRHICSVNFTKLACGTGEVILMALGDCRYPLRFCLIWYMLDAWD